MSKVKICGLFRTEDILTANQYKPDFVGFVFAKSRRQVTEEQAAAFKALLDPEIRAVGVFVDAEITQVARLVKARTIDIVQLHGSEDEAYMKELRNLVDCEIIKAVKVKDVASIERCQDCSADYLLLDNVVAGSGETFDWTYLKACKRPFFLAGGIGLENIKQALEINPYAVDLSSGAETDGVKDANKIRLLVEAVRS